MRQVIVAIRRQWQADNQEAAPVLPMRVCRILSPCGWSRPARANIQTWYYEEEDWYED